MSFDGASSINTILNALQLDPTTRILIESQLTGIVFDQWFTGFKAGQLASIVHAREFYGKSRNELGGTDSSREERTRATSGVGKNSIRSRSDDSSRSGIACRPDTIRERVSGIELTRPSDVSVPEHIYETIASTVSASPGVYVSVHFNGTTLSYALKA